MSLTFVFCLDPCQGAASAAPPRPAKFSGFSRCSWVRERPRIPQKQRLKPPFIAAAAARLKPRPDTSPHSLLTSKSSLAPWLTPDRQKVSDIRLKPGASTLGKRTQLGGQRPRLRCCHRAPIVLENALIRVGQWAPHQVSCGNTKQLWVKDSSTQTEPSRKRRDLEV